jgi:hypothetical protein
MSAGADHRPWPPPQMPWVMAMRWHELLFIHWPVPLAALRRAVPAELTLETFDGTAWIGVVPFRMSGVRPRFVPPLPWLSAFPELNVRTYVTVDGKPGIYFFSLDAANKLAVIAARKAFHLRYYHALMAVGQVDGWIRYTSRRIHRDAPAADFIGRYRPAGTVFRARPGTLDHWLTERYCMYMLDRQAHVYRGEIHHAPWPLQPAGLQIETNSMTAPLGIELPSAAPLLHYAHRQDVVAWIPEHVQS